MDVRQDTFAGGEISPLLWARSSLPKYATACRTLQNMLITQQGAAMNRPGFQYLGRTRLSNQARFIPFSAGVDASFALEFTDVRLRFWTLSGEGQPGLLLDVEGDVYELVSPYLESDLPRLTWAQCGDVLTLCCPGHPVRELKRYDTLDWRLEAVSFAARNAFNLPNVPRLVQPLPSQTENADHALREWKWKVTAICRDYRGATWESLPFVVSELRCIGYPVWSASTTYAVGDRVSPDETSGAYYVCVQAANTNHALSEASWWTGPLGEIPPHVYGKAAPAKIIVAQDRAVRLDWTGYGLWGAPYRRIAYRIYRGIGDRYGWVGDADAESFVDEGRTPDYADGPPDGRNPFEVRDSYGNLIRTEAPTSVAFFEQRRVFAGTAERPGFVFFSRTNDYANFDRHTPARADDACEFELASMQYEDVRSLLPIGVRMLALTGIGPWTVNGAAAGEPLGPTSIEMRARGRDGASTLPPLVASEIPLFVSRSRSSVCLVTEGQDGIRVQTLSMLAEHLFRGRKVVAWTYQARPFSVVWIAFDDGVMVGLSIDRDGDVFAWHHHTIDGEVEDLCCIAEGYEDSVYAVIRRWTASGYARFVERMTSRTLVNQLELNFLDASVAYDGTQWSNRLHVTPKVAGEWGAGAKVRVYSDPGIDLDEGAVIALEHRSGPVRIQLPDGMSHNTVDGILLNPMPNDLLPKLVPEIVVEPDDWGVCTMKITGLDHLDGRMVRTCSDGTPGEVAVIGGEANLPGPALHAFAGLGYESALETLDLAAGRDTRLKQKTVLSVGFEVDRTRGLWLGEALGGKLAKWKEREVATGYGVDTAKTTLAKVTTFNSWNTGGRAVVVQKDPLPVTILSVIREVELGG